MLKNNGCYITVTVNPSSTRMHSSRMRTTCSLTISHCVLCTPQQPCMSPYNHACTTPHNHVCPPQPCMAPTTMHAPCNHTCPPQPHTPHNHAPPLQPPPPTTMHVPHNHTPPQPCTPLQPHPPQPCMSPTTMHVPHNHACPPQPCMPPTTMHAPCNHVCPPAATHAPHNHTCPPQPHMPPCNHTCTPHNHTCSPATTHAPPVNRITDTCKNITFPQLRLWAVTSTIFVYFYIHQMALILQTTLLKYASIKGFRKISNSKK